MLNFAEFLECLFTPPLGDIQDHFRPSVGDDRRRGREEAGGAVATSLARVGGAGGRRRRSQGRRGMVGERRRKLLRCVPPPSHMQGIDSPSTRDYSNRSWRLGVELSQKPPSPLLFLFSSSNLHTFFYSLRRRLPPLRCLPTHSCVASLFLASATDHHPCVAERRLASAVGRTATIVKPLPPPISPL